MRDCKTENNTKYQKIENINFILSQLNKSLYMEGTNTSVGNS